MKQTYLKQILEELAKNPYISPQRIREIAHTASHAVIVAADQIPDTVMLKTADGEALGEYRITVKKPQVIDFMPMMKNGRFVLAVPVVILPSATEENKIWKLIHEYCHLYSIGSYRTEGEMIYHNFGMNCFHYAVSRSEEKIYCVKRTQFTHENEIMNDAAVWYFCEKLFGIDRPPDSYTDITVRPLKDSERLPEMLAAYFSGDDRTVGHLRQYFPKESFSG